MSNEEQEFRQCLFQDLFDEFEMNEDMDEDMDDDALHEYYERLTDHIHEKMKEMGYEDLFWEDYPM